MTGIGSLIETSLLYGALLSLLLSILVLGSLRLNPEIWLNDYPAEIRAQYGAMSAKSKRQGQVVGIFFLLILIGILALSIRQLYQAQAGQLTFGAVFLSTWIILMIFNLVDLVILDWLILVRLQPKFAILPGTAGMPGYKDYHSPFLGFLKGIVITLLASLFISGITVLLVRVVG